MVYAYTGLPGSGKTLSSLALLISELRAGRHVFTNIAGLSPVMIAHALSKGGQVFNLTYVARYLHRFTLEYDNEGANRSRVFKVEKMESNVRITHYYNTQGMELLIADVMACKETVVILDECHEYLNPENFAVLRPFVKYISMARHHGHDLILITQHISDIWFPIQKRIHETHDFFRGQLGIRAHYKERVFYGSNITVAPGYIRQRVNDKSLYCLYKSHDGGAKERLSYMSIWKNKKLIFFLLLLFGIICFSSVYLSRSAVFLERLEKGRVPDAEPVPRYSLQDNVIYVKYVVCGHFDCKAVRPDGTTIALPLDYDSGKYPLEVRKYVPQNVPYGYTGNNSGAGSKAGGSAGGGVPNAR